MHTNFAKVADLTPYERNSRTHSPEQIDQIAESIQRWGFTMPVLVDGDGLIIAGHARCEAAKKIGLEEVPVIVAQGWSEEEKRAYVVADNKLALNAGWDSELLRGELDFLKDKGFELGAMGFDQDELKALMETPMPMVGKTDPDAVPPVPEKTFVEPGDLWQLGPHRLICGDALDPEVIALLCSGDEAVDLLLTDPPYNVDYTGGTGLKIKGDKQPDEAFRKFLGDAFAAADTVLKPGGAFYVWYADSEAYNFHGATRDVGWKLRQVLVWRKSSLVLGKQDYHWMHEPSLYGNKEGGDVAWYIPEHENATYGWKDGSAHEWHSDRKQTTVLEFDKPKKSADHPTMKPVALFQYLMENSTAPGAVVLDSFAGSGTTVIAAAQAARLARVCELDPFYAEVILRRWQTFSGIEPVLAMDGASMSEVKAKRLANQ